MSEDAGAWASGDVRPSQADGNLPSVLDVLVETFEDFREHFAGYILAGLGVWLVMFPIVLVGIIGVFALMAAAAAPGIMANDEDLIFMGAMAAYIGGLCLLMLITACIVPPLQASVGRAMLERISAGADLTIGAAFSTWRMDMFKVIGTYLLVQFIVIVAMLFCYIPGLIAVFLTGLAIPAVIVHRLAPMAAVQLSVKHAMEHPTWHLGYFAITMGISMVLMYIPLIGPALMISFLLSFQLRCYTAVFGLGSEPEWA